ncbi:MAG: hypothetical protein OCC45_00130 [Desulfotalea sp.]
MSQSFKYRYKPGVPKGVHLFFAGMLWTIAGFLLLFRGWHYIWPDFFFFGIIAVVLGFLKSKFILDKTARKSVYRIEKFSDSTCLGAVYSKWSWLLVFLMSFLGVLLRMSPIAKEYLGLFCCTIGVALLWSSRFGWKAWWKNMGNEKE